MKYICYRRFKENSLSGQINIPAMSECECLNGYIIYNNKAICYDTSENGHIHFTRNDDGMGLKRGKLIIAIQDELTKRHIGESDDPNYQKRWDKIWRDNLCQKYKRKEHEDHWLWNHDFYNANIYDLEYIAKLIGLKEVK